MTHNSLIPERLIRPRAVVTSPFAAILTAALFASVSAAADNPANPSFSGTSDDNILFHVFTPPSGVFRQGGPGATLNFSVFNLAAPTGTTAPMTLLSNTPSGGATSSIVLNAGTVVDLPAGSSAPMSLVLNTSTPGHLSVSYTLKFTSSPSSPNQDLAIGATADVYRRGDYDLDGDVDNADYALWRNTLGNASALPPADGNEDGVVNAADYVVWRNNFTGPLGSATEATNLSSSGGVPEPASAVVALLVTGLANLCSRRRQRPAG